jgi:hypothetical protein
MERAGDRQGKMEGYCSTGQSPQWAVVSMEEEEGGGGGGGGGGGRGGGSQLNETNSTNTEIQARILSGSRCYYAYGKLLKSRALNRSSKLKI